MKRGVALAGIIAGAALGGPAQAACQLQTLAELPITMLELKPVFPAKINGQDVRLIADSGAFFSVISPASAAALDLRPTPAPFGFFMSGIGGDATVEIAQASTFELARATLKDVDFIVGGSDIGSGRAVGVVGENLLGLADAEYDLAGGAIRLMRPKGCGDANFAYWAGASQAVSVLELEQREPPQRPFIVGTVIVNGARIRVTFDTGADVSMLSIAAARRAGITTDGPNVRPGGILMGFGRRSVQTWVAPVESFQIGNEAIKHTQLRIADAGEKNEMLIGADFFLSHRVYVANSRGKMYFTYNGGPVFNLSSQPTAAADGPPGAAPGAASGAALGAAQLDPVAEPKDADGFSRRGAAFAARRDDARALADFTKAIELAPAEPRYLYQRAMVRLQQRQPFLAMGDLDAALKLKPDDAEMRLVRAHLRLAGHDKDGALADVDAASAAAPKPSDLRLQMAALYEQMGKYGPAIGQYDLWTHDHGEDSRLAQALNGRCWARALSNQQLDQALSDCDTAVRLSHAMPIVLDSRGLVHLRRGEFDKAIADFDAALKGNPKIAWSLYGRGLAEERTGRADQSRQDIAAALALQPRLGDEASKLGLKPATAAPAPAASG